jgi:hypothetical protein
VYDPFLLMSYRAGFIFQFPETFGRWQQRVDNLFIHMKSCSFDGFLGNTLKKTTRICAAMGRTQKDYANGGVEDAAKMCLNKMASARPS